MVFYKLSLGITQPPRMLKETALALLGMLPQ